MVRKLSTNKVTSILSYSSDLELARCRRWRGLIENQSEFAVDHCAAPVGPYWSRRADLRRAMARARSFSVIKKAKSALYQPVSHRRALTKARSALIMIQKIKLSGRGQD